MDPNPHTRTLLAEAAIFETLIGGDLDFAKLNHSRINLLKAAQSFLVCEKEQISDDAANPTVTDRAQALAALNSLRVRHSSHIAAWNPREVTGNYSRYLAASHTLVAELRDLLAKRSLTLRPG